MVLPRSGLATKGIVLGDLIKHDLIKSFSLPDLIKDFPANMIFQMQRLALQQIFFRWDKGLYHDLYFDYIFIGNDLQSGSIHGNPRENGFPWSCSDIFSIHSISPTKSIANQSLLIKDSFFPSRNEKKRCETRQNGCMGDKFPTRSAGYCVVTKGASTPQKS